MATSAETGREIKVGFVDPLTGAIAGFGIPGKYITEKWQEFAKPGLVCGDGKNHPITIKVVDSQSDSNRAAQVTGDLIQNDKVDFVMAAATPDTVSPVADQAESMGTPCLTADCPMEPYFDGRGADSDHPVQVDLQHLLGHVGDLRQQHRHVGPGRHQQEGRAPCGPTTPTATPTATYYAPLMQEKGYTLIDGGAYNEPNEDFTSQIATFKKEGCEILTGVMIPPDWTNFWKQAKQQGFNPKIAEGIKPTLFPSAMEAIGDIADGLCGPMWFHPTLPFKSSLTGETAQETVRRLREAHEHAVAAADPALRHLRVGRGRPQADHQRGRQRRDHDPGQRDQHAHDHRRSDRLHRSARSAQPPRRPQRRSAPRSTAGQWRLSNGGKYMFDLYICSNAAAPAVTGAGQAQAAGVTAAAWRSC